ncbi:M48 family metallopeptidase [Jiella avicenniae]|uniref:M48 family metallopeptidase n=1 Tax=Jiella avicenniae TaxID=2907202 RepID=A0A9X1P1Z1_9HYPH|nr:SprT family zinc-dependent metalloprotease [Jiella avicenniae]MCE7029033.1 M48 family metallopeptidase [Jiella avicenniae]
MPETIDVAGSPLPLTVRQNPRAKRMIMRIAPGGGGLIVTVPRGMSARKIRGFLDRHRGWVEERLARVPDRVVIAPGAIIPLRGEPTLLTHRGGRLVTRLEALGDQAASSAGKPAEIETRASRSGSSDVAGANGDLFSAAGMELAVSPVSPAAGAKRASGRAAATRDAGSLDGPGDLGEDAAAVTSADAAVAGVSQQLLVGGEERHFSRRVLDFLCREAGRDLADRVKCHSAAVGLEPRAITIKDTTSRWGSCTHDRRLAFSWRIVMAPPSVLDYLAAHEVAHFREMNHGPKFWALCRQLCPEMEAGKSWLKQHGSGLHAVSI